MLAPRRRLFLAMILALSAGPQVASQPQVDPNQALKQAIQLTREHRYAEAESALKGVSPPANPAQK